MKYVLTALGLAFLAIGLITVFLPVPIGLFLILLGTALLVSVNAQARAAVKWLRRRVRGVNDALGQAEKILPEKLAKPLHETEPDEDEPKDEEDDEGEKTRPPSAIPPALPMVKAGYRPRPPRRRPHAR